MQLLFLLLPLSHVFLLLIAGPESSWCHDSSESADNRRFQGRYTRDVRNYEVAIPTRVNPDGTFRSFSLPHFYELNHAGNRERRDDEVKEKHDVHYALTFNNLVHHLELSPNYGLLSPSLVIERRRSARDLSGVDLRSPSDLQCTYVGRVRGQRESRVAVSNCDGLVGHIKTADGHFFIEPAHDVAPEQDGRQLHLVHRHEEDDVTRPGRRTPKCKTADDWQTAWTKRLKYEYKNGSDWSGEFKRSSSEHRFVELCVVADKMFLDHHASSDAEAYVLTIMNMVSDFYHDGSVGNLIDIVIVRIIMLEKEKKEVDLSVSRNAEKTLKSFAAWSKHNNPSSHEHPNHHDVAVLVTRHDICSDNMTQCGLLGLAYVAAACNPEMAACINEDTGLRLSVTVTHEVGHVMGCSHDDPGISGCKPTAPDGSGHVMSPYVKAHTTVWSTCSRKFITEFLDNGLGECLLDEPQDQLFKLPQMPPGAMYDATYQCQTAFGKNAKPCSETIDCAVLWCAVKPGGCTTFGNPPADGTKCGANKWCYNLECVTVGQRPGAVHGGWGSWLAWSPCTRTCGGGVACKERQCDNPPPKHLGRYCVGKKKQYRTCNTVACPPTGIPFRQVQCTERDSKPFNGQLHKWKPFSKEGIDTCVLTCINEQRTYAKLSPRVVDGTPCKPGTRDLCVGGACKHVGCDWQLDSGAEFDQCGICKGDGTQCEHVQATYTKIGHDYVKVVTIPKGVHNVKVKELKASKNTIAVSASSGDKFYLNGQHKEEQDGQYMFGATTLGVYSHPEAQREELVIFGPTQEELILYVVFYTNGAYPGLHYEYFKKKTRRQSSCPPKYNWEFVDWEECSVRCGGGTQISEQSCVEDNGGRVSKSFCQEILKEESISRACNESPCPCSWSVGNWSECKGDKKTRDVKCVMEAPHLSDDDIEVSEDDCKETKPESTETCGEEETEVCSRKTTTSCSSTSDDIKDEDINATENPPEVNATENPPEDNATENPPEENAKENPPEVNATENPPEVNASHPDCLQEKSSRQRLVATEGDEKQASSLLDKDAEDLEKSDDTKYLNVKEGLDTKQLSIEGRHHHVDLKNEKNNLLSLLKGEKHDSGLKEEKNNLLSLLRGDKRGSGLKEEKDNLHSLVRGEKHGSGLKEEKDSLHSLLKGEKHGSGLKEEKDNLHSLVRGEKPGSGLKEEKDNLHSLVRGEKHGSGLKEEKDNLNSLVRVEKNGPGLKEEENNLHSLVRGDKHGSGLKEEKDNLHSLVRGDKHGSGLKEEKNNLHSLLKGEKHGSGLKEEKNNLLSLLRGDKHGSGLKEEKDNLHSLVRGDRHGSGLKEEKDNLHSLLKGENHGSGLKEEKDNLHSLVRGEKHGSGLKEEKDNLHSLLKGEKRGSGLKEEMDNLHSLVRGDRHGSGLKEEKDNLHSLVRGDRHGSSLKEEKDNLHSLVRGEKYGSGLKEEKDNLHSLVRGDKHGSGLNEEKDNLHSLVRGEEHGSYLKDENKGKVWMSVEEQTPTNLKEMDIVHTLIGGDKHVTDLRPEKETSPWIEAEEQLTDLNGNDNLNDLKPEMDNSIGSEVEEQGTNLKPEKDNSPWFEKEEQITNLKEKDIRELKPEKKTSPWMEAKEQLTDLKENDNLNDLKTEKDNSLSNDNFNELKPELNGLPWNEGYEKPASMTEINGVNAFPMKDDNQLLYSTGGKDNQQLSMEGSIQPADLKDELYTLQWLKNWDKRHVGLKNYKENVNSLVAREKKNKNVEDDKNNLHFVEVEEKDNLDMKGDMDNLHFGEVEEKDNMDMKGDKDKLHFVEVEEKHNKNLKNDKYNVHSLLIGDKYNMDLKDDKAKLYSVEGEEHNMGLKDDKNNLHSVEVEEENKDLKDDKEKLQSVEAEEGNMDLKDDKDNVHSVEAREKHIMNMKDDTDNVDKQLPDFKSEQWLTGFDIHPSGSNEMVARQDPSKASTMFSVDLKGNETAPLKLSGNKDEDKQLYNSEKKHVSKSPRHHKHKLSGKGSKMSSNSKIKHKERNMHRGKKRRHGRTKSKKSKLAQRRMRHNYWKKHHHKQRNVDHRLARDDDENDNEEDLEVTSTTPGCSKSNKKDHILKQNEEVEDRVPEEDVVLIEVPLLEPNSTNINGTHVLSDEGEEEMGDPETVMLDTKNEKVYHGKEAMDKINEMEKGEGNQTTVGPNSEC